jgi:hypothetical protein
VKTASAGQLGLFDLAELEPPAPSDPCDLPAPCLFNSPARGLLARLADPEAWREKYGNFGSVPRSHGFHHLSSCPTSQLDRCETTIFLADQAPYRRPELRTCDCDGPGVYIAVCRGRDCLWESPHRHDENTAAEDGLDHAWPGWRDLPVIRQLPYQPTAKAEARWWAALIAQYPVGWVEGGGPIRTWRGSMGLRHVPNRTKFGGYDIGVLGEGE